MLGQCEKEQVFRGTIIDFDTEDYVPKERHTKGMKVTSKEGTHQVDFYSGSVKYIEDASSLKMSVDVIVLGKENPHRPNNILPAILIVPKENLVLLAREQENFRSEGWVENVKIVSYTLGLIFGVLSWLSNDIPFILFHTFFLYWEVTFWFGLVSLLFFLLLIAVSIYDRHTRRGRVVRCDPETWNTISDEVFKRFAISIT